MRILILIAIGLLLYIIINNQLRRIDKEKADNELADKMVQCEHCGLHILETEALQDGQHYYCSEAHKSASH
jgi:uncharacterized protein